MSNDIDIDDWFAPVLSPEKKEEEPYIPIAWGIRFLAGLDGDYARERNGVGFNQMDTERGHRLALMDYEDWSKWDRWWAWERIQMYRRQFAAENIDISRFIQPPKPEKEEPFKSCTRLENGFQLILKNIPNEEYNSLRTALYEIPGRQWRSGSEVFIPLDAPAIRAFLPFAEKYGFEIDEDTKREMRELFLYADIMVDASKARNFDIDAIPKDFTLKLETNHDGTKTIRPFQKAGVWYIEQATKRMRQSDGTFGNGVLVADDMGLGKTIETMLALEDMLTEEQWKRGVLILCPNTVKPNWADELKDWLPHRKLTIVSYGYAQSIKGEIVLANYDILRYKVQNGKREQNDILEILHFRDWYAVVADECHKLKSQNAMRSQAVDEFIKEIKPPLRIYLSGSPVLNRAEEYISQLGHLNLLEDFGSPWRFLDEAKRFPKEVNLKLRGKGFLRRPKEDEVRDYEGFLIPKGALPPSLRQEAFETREAWLDALRSRSYEITEGVLTELPGKQRMVRMVNLDPEWKKKYDSCIKDFAQYLWEEMQEKYKNDLKQARAAWARGTGGAATLRFIEECKRLSAAGKMHGLIEFIEDFLEENTEEKLVVFAYHREFQNTLAAHFEGCARIHSDDDIWVRRQNQQRFLYDTDCRLIICSMKAGGEGINLFSASNVVFLELDWGPKPHDQAEDRLNRMGQHKSVNCYYMIAPGTIDLTIVNLIDAKRAIVTQLTEGEDADRAHMIQAIIEDVISAA